MYSERKSANVLEIWEEKTSQPKITIAFPLLKNKHDSLIVEKLTELGVKEFFPLITERTVRQPSKNTLDKFTKIAISAIKQCDNAFLPKIHEFSTLKVLIDKLQKMHKQPLVALETGEHRLLVNVVQEFNEQELCLIFGPEGGFSPAEIDFLHQKNIPIFTLGNHVLRAETAAITSVSQLLGFYLKQNPKYY
jgi:16S rRNA (uracil1498-N3)-methyltransferase